MTRSYSHRVWKSKLKPVHISEALPLPPKSKLSVLYILFPLPWNGPAAYSKCSGLLEKPQRPLAIVVCPQLKPESTCQISLDNSYKVNLQLYFLEKTRTISNQQPHRSVRQIQSCKFIRTFFFSRQADHSLLSATEIDLLRHQKRRGKNALYWYAYHQTRSRVMVSLFLRSATLRDSAKRYVNLVTTVSSCRNKETDSLMVRRTKGSFSLFALTVHIQIIPKKKSLYSHPIRPEFFQKTEKHF